jgi:hypothetical protein
MLSEGISACVWLNYILFLLSIKEILLKKDALTITIAGLSKNETYLFNQPKYFCQLQ